MCALCASSTRLNDEVMARDARSLLTAGCDLHLCLYLVLSFLPMCLPAKDVDAESECS